MTIKRGFALIAVLWVIAALVALVSVGLRGVSLASVATRNRVSLARSRWVAEACLAVEIARLDSLAAAHEPLAPPPERQLAMRNLTSCISHAYEPAGRLHRDSAPSDMLGRLDSVVRVTSTLPVDSFLTEDGDGRIDVNVAPFEVLAALPGLGTEGARAVVATRQTRRRLSSIADITAILPGRVRDSVNARYGELQRMVAFVPSSLVLAAIGRDSRAPPISTIEVLLVPAGSRLAVIRRRMR